MHFELAVNFLPRTKPHQVRKVISAHGGLTHSGYIAATKAARAISQSEFVTCVTITAVTERHDSVWRKGRKT